MRREKRKLAGLFALLVLMALAVGCGGKEPAATPTPTKTPRAEAEAPTDTPVPPTATPTSAPTPTATAEPEALPAQLMVTGDIVYARGEPSLSGGEMGALTLGDVVDVLARSEDGAWYRVCCVAGEEAWMAAEFLGQVDEAIAIREPTPTSTSEPITEAQPTTDGVNARKGPGTGYGKVGLIYTSDTFEVLGKNEAGTWYKLCCVNGEEAWVSGDFLALSGEVGTVAIAETPSLTDENRADSPSAGSGPGASGRVSAGDLVPATDNPPPGKYWGLCGLDVPRPVREVPPSRPGIAGNVNPLTGQPVDPALLQRRILIVRMGHEPAIKAYYGLTGADLVFEEIMDSLNTTRFTTVWLAGDAPQVGPLRSYRSTSIQLAQMYNAPLASSGAVGLNQVLAYRTGIEDLDWRCSTRPYFMNPNVPSSDWQNRAVSSIPRLRSFIESNGINTPAWARPFAFSESPPGGSPANSVVVPYVNRGYYEVEWRYDSGSGRYVRFQGTSRFPLTDGNNGQQVTAANVVVMYVRHDLTDIVEDSVGSLSVRTYITGQSGRATVVRNGVAVEGRWRVADKWDNLELVDGGGNPIPLKPGNTWFQIVPTSYNVTVQ